MVFKLTASLMLALLLLPSCCCLKKDRTVEEDSASKCCASAESSLLNQEVPLHNGTEPCECGEMVAQVLGLPEHSVLISDSGQVTAPTAQIELQRSSCQWQVEASALSLTRLSAFHPPGSRLLQDYCVYRI